MTVMSMSGQLASYALTSCSSTTSYVALGCEANDDEFDEDYLHY